MAIKISVVTINLNNKKGLERTILSVLKQDYKELEYIIIDGNSIDGSIDVIKKYEDSRLHWTSEKDSGIYNAMNKGIIKATGTYIIMLNSGDELYSPETITNLCKEPLNADVIYGNLIYIEDLNHKEYFKNSLDFKKMTFKLWYIGCSIPHPGTMIKKSCLVKYGFYDESLKVVSDWKFFLLGMYKYNFSFLKKNIITARFYLDGISSSKENVELIQEERANVISKEFPLLYPDYSALYSHGSKNALYLSEIQQYSIARKIAMLALKLISFIKC